MLQRLAAAALRAMLWRYSVAMMRAICAIASSFSRFACRFSRPTPAIFVCLLACLFLLSFWRFDFIR